MPPNPSGKDARKETRRVPGLCVDNPHAPFMYFDVAVTMSINREGICQMALGATRVLPDQTGAPVNDTVIVAHLRGGLAAMRNLKEAVDKLLLLGARAEGDKH